MEGVSVKFLIKIRKMGEIALDGGTSATVLSNVLRQAGISDLSPEQRVLVEIRSNGRRGRSLEVVGIELE